MAKIYKNLWSGHEFYFVPTHTGGRKGEAQVTFGYDVLNVNGEWRFSESGGFYSSDLKDQEHFPVVGNVKLDIGGYVISEVLKALRGEHDEQADC